MKYFLFLDESGDHGLGNIDQGFPVFVLCGIIVSKNSYTQIKKEMNRLKQDLWQNKNVIFHSRDIRKCNDEFKILFDLNVKEKFYNKINEIVNSSNYSIISSGIQKEKYIHRYGKLTSDVYEIALSFIVERTVFYLDDVEDENKSLEIIIEKRGAKEDAKLNEHFNRLLSWGTGYVSANRLKNYQMKISFKHKEENINGLQLSDLIAYPIARHIINPKRVNPAFDKLSDKFYMKNGKRYGLKIFP
ncbi:MAG: hypothetical protein SCARUB_04900 [Candidatus Scalindua rubra]|uniref:DUF3800 domain-containing protein n=1 Tax=Candidatus Scalindua rubra TaxID=1872076 RepID=A0A1E3X2Z2_9BACT|nr:MAG: hypothetical protein SCARUB_04900 [Candidatus Scalindua rubra]